MDEQRLKQFFTYIAKRHTIYKKRLQGLPAPWTDDSVLQNYKFTNVFRDLDPGTKYVTEKILPQCKTVEDVLFNIIIYRFFNKIQTFDAAGIQHARTFDRASFERNVRTVEKPFTNAFLVSGYANVPGKDKVEKVCTLLATIAEKIPAVAEDISKHKDSEHTFLALRALPGLGDFLAYQIAVDMGYYDRSLFDESSYVVCGPGCKQGLKLIFGDDGVERIHELEAMQDEQFRKIGADMQTLFSDRNEKKLNLMALENCLCEFSKYVKAVEGTGRPRNTYKHGKI